MTQKKGSCPGIPSKIMVDNGPMMTSQSVKDLFARLGIVIVFTNPMVGQRRTSAELKSLEA